MSKVPVLSGLAQNLGRIFPEEPVIAVEEAVAHGLIKALGEENLGLHDIVCDRDYSRLCPDGGHSFIQLLGLILF